MNLFPSKSTAVQGLYAHFTEINLRKGSIISFIAFLERVRSKKNQLIYSSCLIEELFCY